MLDLLPLELQKRELFPVGRLDKDTEGLLLLTDDGPLAHRLLSPRRHVDKVYYARLDGVLTEADCAAFADGLVLEDGYRCLPAQLRLLADDGGRSEVLITLHEGKFHQVKRMAARCGAPVFVSKTAFHGAFAPGSGFGVRKVAIFNKGREGITPAALINGSKL